VLQRHGLGCPAAARTNRARLQRAPRSERAEERGPARMLQRLGGEYQPREQPVSATRSKSGPIAVELPYHASPEEERHQYASLVAQRRAGRRSARSLVGYCDRRRGDTAAGVERRRGIEHLKAVAEARELEEIVARSSYGTVRTRAPAHGGSSDRRPGASTMRPSDTEEGAAGRLAVEPHEIGVRARTPAPNSPPLRSRPVNGLVRCVL